MSWRVLRLALGLGFAVSLALGARRDFPLPWTWLFLFSAASLAAVFSDRSHPRRAERLIFWSALAAYLSTFRWHGGDDIPGSLLPFSLLRHATLSLDPFAGWLEEHGLVDFFVRLDGRVLSTFPIAPSLMVAPLYVIPAAAGVAPTEQFLHNLSKIGASAIAAASVVLFHRIVEPRVEKKWAWCLTLAYAFGSYTFSVASQALYQHGPAQLAMLAALWALSKPEPAPRDLGLAGFSLGWAAACRFDSLAFGAPLALGVLLSRPRRGLARFVAFGLLPLAGLAAYNWYYTGGLRPPEYGFQAGLFRSFQPEAPSGMLLSPTRGLLPLFPVFLFGVWGLLGKKPLFPWYWAPSVAIGCLATVLLYCFRPSWTGGGTFGMRYFALLCAMLGLFCAQTETEVRSDAKVRALWSAAMAVSILVHAIGGYFTWPGSFVVEEQKRRLWDWSLYPPVYLVAPDGPLAALGASGRAVLGAAVLAGIFTLARAVFRAMTPHES